MLFNSKKILRLFLFMLFISLCSIGVVSAVDTTIDDEILDESLKNNLNMGSSNIVVKDYSYSSNVGESDIIKLNAADNDDYYNSTASTFTELKNDLDAHDKVRLTRNVSLYYKEVNDFKEGIWISKNRWIDGNGYTINACGKTRIFASCHDLNLQNLNLINGHCDNHDRNDGGAIISLNILNCTNCNFTNNYADDSGGAIKSKQVILSNCNFINNICDDDDGGTIFTEEGVVCFNCSFIGNKANDNGGAIYTLTGGVLVTDCTFNSNEVCNDDGGAIYSEYDSVTVTNCSFSGNKANDNGGAIYSGTSSVKVTDSDFKSNIARNWGSGGAIWADEGVECFNCSFIGNWAHDDGGAIFSDDSGVGVTDCIFNSNEAWTGNGGAIWADEGVESSNCSFINNTADSSGGAVFSDDNGVTVSDCKFIGNVARYDGGAIHADNGVTATNCEFRDNHADYGDGGAMYSDDFSSEVAISSCSFSGNYAGDKGHSAYTYGDFTKLESNTFYSNDFGNCFVEWGLFSDDEHEGNE